MKRCLLAVATTLLAACGASSSTPVATSTPTPSPSLAPAVTLTTKPAFGAVLSPVLSNTAGFTLYYFAPDAASTPTCVDTCAQTWSPFLAPQGATVQRPPSLAGPVSTIHRPDGTLQVTYNSWPLYTYSGDQQGSDVKGDGIAGKWHVATPALGQPSPSVATGLNVPTGTPLTQTPPPAPVVHATPTPAPHVTPVPTYNYPPPTY